MRRSCSAQIPPITLRGTLVGPIAAAAFFLLLREGLSRYFTEYYPIPVGIIFTAMVIFMPQGLLGFAKRRLNQSMPMARDTAAAGRFSRNLLVASRCAVLY
jgi:hypothetical protein